MKKLLICFPLILLIFACGNDTSTMLENAVVSDYESFNGASAVEEKDYNQQKLVTEQNSDLIEDGKEEDASNELQPTIERKLIKTGSVSFETTDVNKTYANLVQLVANSQGYLSDERQNNYGDMQEQTLTVRMPSQNFDSFIDALGKSAGVFDNKYINVQDVTEEYIDIQSRLKTKYALETSYLELLNKAKSVGDVLDVERELSYVREEIESMEGRMRYLKDKISFSTLTITYYQYNSVKAVNFFGEIGSEIESGWRGLRNFILGLFSIWPFVLVVLCAIFLVRFWIKRKKRN